MRRLVDDLVKDTAYAWRMLLRSPGFALTAVLSLALGIGANTAIFSLVDTVLLRLLPVERPRDLVFLQTAGTTGRGGAPPYPFFERVRDETSAFAGMAAFASDELRVQVDGAVEQVFGQVASGSYFDVLGLQPAAGRLMTPEDEKLDPPVAVIGYGYWQRRFGGSPAAIGRTVSFGDRMYTIVGVTPAQFWGLQPGRQVDVTLPITQATGMLANANTWWFDAIARLRPAATVAQATAQADAVFQSFMQEHQQSELQRTRASRLDLPSAAQGLDRLRSRFSMPLYTLTLVAGIVLLIACANLGNLLLARGTARAREFAIRLATGAGASRLFRQLLTETLVLFVLGTAGGLLIAHVTIQTLTGFFSGGRRPILLDVQYDWRLAAFATAVALAAALLTGLWPAVRALRDRSAGGDERRRGAAGGLAANGDGGACARDRPGRALARAAGGVGDVREDDGESPRRRHSDSTEVACSRCRSIRCFRRAAGTGAREQFWTRVLERVRMVPGVRAASLSVLTPLSGRDTGRGVTVAGFQPRSPADGIVAPESRLRGLLPDVRHRAPRRTRVHSARCEGGPQGRGGERGRGDRLLRGT